MYCYPIGQAYDLNTPENLPTLAISMYNKGSMLSTDDPLGKISIPLETIDPSGGEVVQWYPLEKAGRMKGVTGEVLRFEFSCYRVWF